MRGVWERTSNLKRRHRIVWIRYLAAVRGFQVLFGLILFRTQISKSHGEGGGGPISVAEMRQHLLLDPDELVFAVCHTDSVQAYRILASPLYEILNI